MKRQLGQSGCWSGKLGDGRKKVGGDEMGKTVLFANSTRSDEGSVFPWWI